MGAESGFLLGHGGGLDPFNTTGDALKDYRTGFNPITQMRPDSAVEDAVLTQRRARELEQAARSEPD